MSTTATGNREGASASEGPAATPSVVIPSNLSYVLISIVVLFISTRVLQAGVGHVFALLVSGLIISYLRSKQSTDVLSFNATMDYRNELLSNPSHFYLDTNMINLFYSIYGWRSLNPSNYENAIAAANNVLRFRSDAEKPLERCVDNYEVAREQSKLCLNYVHSFVHVLRHPLLIKKLRAVLARLQQLLERSLETIRKACVELEKAKPLRDVNSRFIEDANGPHPFDPYTADSPFHHY